MDSWTLALAAGGSLVALAAPLFPALFLKDGQHVVLVTASQLRVYFVASRQCVRTIAVDLSRALSAHMDPESDLVIVFGPDSLCYVNWRESVDEPIVVRQLYAIAGLALVFAVDQVYHALAEDDGLAYLRIDKEHVEPQRIFHVPECIAHSVSRDRLKLVVVGKTTVLVYDLSGADHESIAATKEEYPHEARLCTAVAISNTGTVALGAKSGVVTLVYARLDAGRGSRHRLLKWHMDAVGALVFSHDETYLVLGGQEKVLVFWHLELGRKQFLPRLAAPVCGAAVDAARPDLYSVLLGAGAQRQLVVLSAADLVSRMSVAPASLREDAPASTVCAVHAPTQQLYLAHGTRIQAYDVARGEQVFVQEAVLPLSTGKVKSETLILEPEVVAVCFSADGQWMATADRTAGDADNLLLRLDEEHLLKFWRKGERWELVLKIVEPHGAHAVGALVATPRLGFTLVDTHGGVRLWRPNDANVWTLRRGTEPLARALKVAAAWSGDGSLLVVAHAQGMRAWDPALAPVDYLFPRLETDFELVHIVGHHLVAAAQTRTVVFDTLTGYELALMAHLRRCLVAVDPVRDLVAVAALDSGRGRVLVLQRGTKQPVHSFVHPREICALAHMDAGFVFVDAVAAVHSVLRSPETAVVAQSLALAAAQAAAQAAAMAYAKVAAQEEESDDGSAPASKVLDAAVFQPVFANTDAVGMETLFERVVRAVQ